MLFDDTYKTIEKQSEGVFKDRGSKFIAYAIPVTTEEQAKKHLAEIRKEYHDACHHCFAYRIGPDKQTWRSSDDGEPSGTAGKPIYNQILSKDLTNIFIVVVRYFGGTLLGVPGLINAYKTATLEALNNAVIITKTVNDIYEVSYDYPLMNDVMKIIKDRGLEILSTDFSESCKISFKVRKGESATVYDSMKKLASLRITYTGTI
jgi:uncharacterized YigZ family protein